MFLYASLLLIVTPILCTELCKEKEFFNDLTGKCQACSACTGRAKEVAPCLEFSDTFCVDLVEIVKSLEKRVGVSANTKPDNPPKWHEMEGKDGPDVLVQETTLFRTETMWSKVILVMLFIAFMCVLLAAIFTIIRFCSKTANRNELRKTVARNRLFSRDRLNTTEYMNNLATLDRRLAIDEILEKRKRAIFEPQLLNENIYTDEVFVDISGLPRNLHANRDYEELDNRKCLLQMQDHQ